MSRSRSANVLSEMKTGLGQFHLLSQSGRRMHRSSQQPLPGCRTTSQHRQDNQCSCQADSFQAGTPAICTGEHLVVFSPCCGSHLSLSSSHPQTNKHNIGNIVAVVAPAVAAVFTSLTTRGSGTTCSRWTQWADCTPGSIKWTTSLGDDTKSPLLTIGGCRFSSKVERSTQTRTDPSTVLQFDHSHTSDTLLSETINAKVAAGATRVSHASLRSKSTS